MFYFVADILRQEFYRIAEKNKVCTEKSSDRNKFADVL